jgi:hypothetical protein
MISKFIAIASFVFIASACSSTSSRGDRATAATGSPVVGAGQASRATVAVRAAERGLRVPIRASWEVLAGRPDGGEKLTLALRIERLGRWPLPINVAVQVPIGARLLRGATQATLAANPDPGIEDLEFELMLDVVPVADLVAVVDSQSPGAGVHAEPRYSFGRPDPVPQRPEANGPHLRFGGHDFGPAIMVENKHEE